MTQIIAFGDNDLTIETGTHLDMPAVLISNGADMVALTFPTHDQALKVARALCSIPEPKKEA